MAATCVIALAAAEVGVRLVGRFRLVDEWRNYQPITREPVDQSWAAYDGELGWINSPAAHNLTWDSGPVTFLADGSRKTGEEQVHDTRPILLVLGCSFTQGLGVSDPETYSWKLQERFPDFHVINFGTGGYSTYQSLLRFRRFVKTSTPAVVVFGFGEFQGVRDRATRSWMYGMNLPFLPPHVDLRDGRLVEFPLTPLPEFAAERFSAAAHVLVETYFERWVYAADDDETLAVHHAALRLLRDEVAHQGARFLIANLWATQSTLPAWRTFFHDARFQVAECVTPDTPGGHPDAFWNAHHAECIDRALRRSSLSTQ